MTYVLRVDIFESKHYPVVRHEFRGATPAECVRYFKAHLKTDQFLAGCLKSHKWNTVNCTTRLTRYTE